MKNIFKRIGTFAENHVRLIVIITLILVVLSAIGLTQLKMDSSLETMISPESQVRKDSNRFNADFSGKVVAILLEAENTGDLLEPQNVQAMASIEDNLNSTPSIISALGPAFVIRQILEAQTGSSVIPNDHQMLMNTVMNVIMDSATGEIGESFTGVFPDARHGMIAVVLDAELDVAATNKVIDKIFRIVEAEHFTNVKLIVTGEPVATKKTIDLLGTTMRTVMIIAVIIMLVILALVFKVRNSFAWRWMPLGAVLIAVVLCFGLMGFIGLKITLVTLSALPVLIGLGADYAIQFHNRYNEEVIRGKTFAEAVIDSVTHIGPAIGMAIVIACLGFAALFFSPIPPVQDFGLSLIIGVVACYIVSLFFMMAILYWNDKRSGRKYQATAPEIHNVGKRIGFVERGLGWLAPRVLRNPAIILPIALVLFGVGIFMDREIGALTDPMKFNSSGLAVMQDLRKLEDITGGRTCANIFVEAKDVTEPETIVWMKNLEESVIQGQSSLVFSTNSLAGLITQYDAGVMPSTSKEIKAILQNVPSVAKRNLVTEDFTSANLVINVRVPNTDQIKSLKEALESYIAANPPPDGVKASVTGPVIMIEKMIGGLTGGRIKMTLIGIVFALCGLLVVFRFRIFRALAAILPIGFIIGWSAMVMYLAGFEYSPLTATLGALTIGIGVEFTILLMMRFYEERAKGETPSEAMTIAMTRIGRAIIASGLTVVGGFGALLAAVDFPILQDFGVMTMINVLFALISTLIVLPPLIVGIESWLQRRSVAIPTQKTRSEA